MSSKNYKKLNNFAVNYITIILDGRTKLEFKVSYRRVDLTSHVYKKYINMFQLKRSLAVLVKI